MKKPVKTIMFTITAFALLIAVAAVAGDDKKVNPSEMGGTYVGDVVADAMRASLGADIAFINGGSLGFEGLPDKLNKDNVNKLVPFSTDSVVTAKLKGASIVAALEQSCSRLPRRSSTFLQVSGITFTCDANADPGGRVSDVRFGGKAIDMQKEYLIATTEFVMSGGGGLKAFKDGKPAGDKSMQMGDIVLKSAAYDGKRAGAGSARITIIEVEE